MMNRIKHLVKRTFPRSYQRLYSSKEYCLQQSRTEYRVLREIVRRILRGKWRGGATWTEVLPVQPPRRVGLRGVVYSTIAALRADLDSRGLAYSNGEDSVYLPPATVQIGPFKEIGTYPPNVGLQIMTSAVASGDAFRHDDSPAKTSLSRASELVLVANLLHASNVGPRLYDAIQLECGGASWSAYILEHIVGSPPSASECEEGLTRIRELERTKLLRIALPEGFEHRDFQCPGCNGHALMDAGGNFRYLRFQNFALVEYGRYLEQTAIRSTQDVHFGGESLLRSGRFLYQSIPGVRLAAKRSIDDRIVVIEQLMKSAGVSVKGRLVLDVGCNAGMMMAEYLKRGAAWCHGWDTAAIAPHADALLLALGCTRFSTTGTFIEPTRRLEDDLPGFARSLLPGCVISYLAVRFHLGWLDALASIPWAFLIYEGHQYETEEDAAEHCDQLRKRVDVKMVSVGRYSEGVSNERIVTIIANLSVKSPVV